MEKKVIVTVYYQGKTFPYLVTSHNGKITQEQLDALLVDVGVGPGQCFGLV